MRRRVMVWGLSGDPPFDAVCRELARSRTPSVVVDQRRDAPQDVADAAALFFRAHDPVGVDDRLRFDREALRRAHVDHFALLARVEIADAFVVNRPSAMATNSSKPYQAELIRAHGLAVPQTLVTTTPDAARDFITRHGSAIYKSVSDVRSAVTRIDGAAALENVANAPTQFQSYVSGTDWRVHVIGDDVFACEIHCDADDYRRAPLDNVPLRIREARLPAAVAARCHALAQSLGLPVTGIDLRRTPEDLWFCFEANPAPAFTYYEAETGQPLAAAIVALLATAAATHRRAA